MNETSILISFQIHCKTNRNQLEIILEATYGLHFNKYFKIMNLKFREKKSGDEALLASFKFLRRIWDQSNADFNKFSHIEARSCYSCLVSYLHGETDKSAFRSPPGGSNHCTTSSRSNVYSRAESTIFSLKVFHSVPNVIFLFLFHWWTKNENGTSSSKANGYFCVYN